MLIHNLCEIKHLLSHWPLRIIIGGFLAYPDGFRYEVRVSVGGDDDDAIGQAASAVTLGRYGGQLTFPCERA